MAVNNVIMSEEQFHALMDRMLDLRIPQPQAQRGSFAKSTARFRGETDHQVVESFLSTITVYKNTENIAEADAITGFQLLLEKPADTWWEGVKEEIVTWEQLVSTVRNTFAPLTPNYKLLQDTYEVKQHRPGQTDQFVIGKRALLAKLSIAMPMELQLDMVYSLLHLDIRKRVARRTFQTYDELLGRTREAESILEEEKQAQKPTYVEKAKCAYCKNTGHRIDECRKRIRETTTGSGNFQCYGCGRPNTIRSKCPTCTKKSVNQISTLTATVDSRRPHTYIHINGKAEYALFDTGSHVTVASLKLYDALKRNGHTFRQERGEYAFANGKTTSDIILMTEADVHIKEKVIRTTFCILPHSQTRETILGTDFLEQAGISIDLGQKTWTFTGGQHPTYDAENPRIAKQMVPRADRKSVV